MEIGKDHIFVYFEGNDKVLSGTDLNWLFNVKNEADI